MLDGDYLLSKLAVKTPKDDIIGLQVVAEHALRLLNKDAAQSQQRRLLPLIGSLGVFDQHKMQLPSQIAARTILRHLKRL